MSEPRIPPRPAADWDAEVKDALSVLRPPDNTRKASDAKPAGDAKPRQARHVSNILGVFCWHPALAKSFFTFNNHLFASTLTARDRELATVRVACLRRGEYEWSQHVAMARVAGVTEAEIEATSVGPDAPVWSERDATLLRAVDELVNDRYLGDETWKQVAKYLDRKQVMDLVFTVGAYDMLAMAMNTFGLQLDPDQAGFPQTDRNDPE